MQDDFSLNYFFQGDGGETVSSCRWHSVYFIQSMVYTGVGKRGLITPVILGGNWSVLRYPDIYFSENGIHRPEVPASPGFVRNADCYRLQWSPAEPKSMVLQDLRVSHMRIRHWECSKFTGMTGMYSPSHSVLIERYIWIDFLIVMMMV